MDEKTRTEYLQRMQAAMRAMTDAEIAEAQWREVHGTMNSDSMRDAAEMQSFSCPYEAGWIPLKPKPTVWQQILRLFVKLIR